MVEQLREFAEGDDEPESVEEIQEEYARGEIGDRELEDQLEQAVDETDEEMGEEEDTEEIAEILGWVAFGVLLLLSWLVGLPLIVAWVAGISPVVAVSAWDGGILCGDGCSSSRLLGAVFHSRGGVRAPRFIGTEGCVPGEDGTRTVGWFASELEGVWGVTPRCRRRPARQGQD